jgi:hypothetical protein
MDTVNVLLAVVLVEGDSVFTAKERVNTNGLYDQGRLPSQTSPGAWQYQ